jgi:hypothetical protein
MSTYHPESPRTIRRASAFGGMAVDVSRGAAVTRRESLFRDPMADAYEVCPIFSPYSVPGMG